MLLRPISINNSLPTSHLQLSSKYSRRILEMQRQLCVKILSKIPRNASAANANFVPPKSVFSSTFSKASGNPFYRQSCSEYSTLSRSRFWNLSSSEGISEWFRRGVLPNSVLARSFISNTLLKGRSQFPLRVHSRRSFHSLDSRNRNGVRVFKRLSTDGVVLGLIITNVAVFVLWGVAGHEFMVKNFMISVDNFTSGRLHTLITSAFSHRDLLHLFPNMLGLYFFGMSVGQTFGPKYLLKLYLSGAVFGSIFYLTYHAFVAQSIQGTKTLGFNPSRVPALGASGAVNAIMLLDIFLYPTKTIYLNLFIPIPAILVGIFIIGDDIRRALQGDEQVSGSAHLGGATVAALAWLRSRRGRFGRF